ncbi:hypothetical protein OZX69_03035 [Lactobacillus sp. ESL0731]|uniref:hypothetical protein n=1 Tax=unclassified Lactobacillus TaxID=2620435 RepID=UPI0023F6BA41|nr:MULTISPECIES: hypothetical protein [unclassified Lactobacillus]WEV51684.1 hypothetical protein OZX63_03035 [Lactobacillus sp. ESL0700]WEV62813.1 hypothetical protein OZX69_03035 [Lactobacillus sp. ESL0731]
MSKYNKTVLTNAGIELAKKVNTGQAKFSITKAATSSENLSDKSIAELQNMTELPSIMQYGVITDVEDTALDKDTVIGMDLKFNNKELAHGYSVNAIGLYAKEDGGSEFLYAIATAVDPEHMPDFNDKAMFQFNVTMYVVVGQSSSVTINVTEEGVATKKYVDDELEKKVDKTTYDKDKKQLEDGIKEAGKVESVNLIKPDPISKDVSLTSENIPHYNSSVKQTLDSLNNTKAEKVNGAAVDDNKNIFVPVFAPNLLKGTSKVLHPIAANDDTQICTLQTTPGKYSVAVNIDYSKFSSGTAGAQLHIAAGSDGAADSNLIVAGSQGRVIATIEIKEVSYVTISIHSSSAYVGAWSCLKASCWQNASTPPDMTWLPNPDDKVDSKDFKVGGTNLFVKSTLQHGWLDHTAQGGIQDSTSDWHTDYIRSAYRTPFILSFSHPSDYIKSNQSNVQIDFYDENKNWIDKVNTGADWTADTDVIARKFDASKAYWLRVSVNYGSEAEKDSSKTKLEYGTVVTDWSPAPEDMTSSKDFNSFKQDTQKALNGKADGQVDGHTVYELLNNFIKLWGGDAQRMPEINGKSQHFFDQVEWIGRALTNSGFFANGNDAYTFPIRKDDGSYSNEQLATALKMISEYAYSNKAYADNAAGKAKNDAETYANVALTAPKQDISNLKGRVTTLENREYTHDSGTDAAALTYSKTHPSVIVFGD